MAKTLYFYSLLNGASQAIRADLVSSGLAFTELRLDQDFRKHGTDHPGVPVIVIDVDQRVYKELTSAANIANEWNAAPDTWPQDPGGMTAEELDIHTLKGLVTANPSALTASENVRLFRLLQLVAKRLYQEELK